MLLPMFLEDLAQGDVGVLGRPRSKRRGKKWIIVSSSMERKIGVKLKFECKGKDLRSDGFGMPRSCSEGSREGGEMKGGSRTSSSSVLTLSGRISVMGCLSGRWSLAAGRFRWASRPL